MFRTALADRLALQSLTPNKTPIQSPLEGAANMGSMLAQAWGAKNIRAGVDEDNQRRAQALAKALADGNPAKEAQISQTIGGDPDLINAAATAQFNSMLNPREQYEPITDANGNIIAQRSTKTGQVVVDPRAPKQRESKLLTKEELDQQLSLKHAGKPETNVKVETKTGESLAKPIGDMMEQSKASALGSLDTIDSVTRMRGAIEKANVNLGPTATLRQTGDQIAATLGIGGKDTAERLANTRTVVKGLAELSLAARKTLKGQGQVSDFEGRLLERAASGSIDDLTMPEMKVILDVSDRLARKQYEIHQGNLKNITGNPDYKALAPFYGVPEMPAATPPAAGTNIDALRNKYGITPTR